MKLFRRTSGKGPWVGQGGPFPFRNQKHFVIVNLQNIGKIKQIFESGFPFLKIMDPPLNLAALTTAYIA
jgi:hypothetical protein